MPKPHHLKLELDEELIAATGIRQEPGWTGAFTRQEAPGGIPNGASIVRDGMREKGDATPHGIRGVVLGSIYVPNAGYAYFVEFENRPKTAIFVIAAKIRWVQ